MEKLTLAVILSLVLGIFVGILINAFMQPAPVQVTSDAQQVLERYPLDLAAMTHTHPQLEVPAAEAPLVELAVFRDPAMAGDFAVHIKTSNFEFAPQNVSTPHITGQGHAHIFVDDVKLGRIYGEWYHLPTLKPGRHDILVTLSTNDHKEYAVRGRSIAASTIVDVPEDRSMQMDSMPCHQMPDGTWMGECDVQE